MFLASKAAWGGIVLILLTMGISGPRPTPLASGAALNNELLVGRRNDVVKMQEALRDSGHYRGEVDGVLGLRTQAGVREFQEAENLPVTGSLTPGQPVNSGSDRMVARTLATRLRKVNLRQE